MIRFASTIVLITVAIWVLPLTQAASQSREIATDDQCRVYVQAGVKKLANEVLRQRYGWTPENQAADSDGDSGGFSFDRAIARWITETDELAHWRVVDGEIFDRADQIATENPSAITEAKGASSRANDGIVQARDLRAAAVKEIPAAIWRQVALIRKVVKIDPKHSEVPRPELAFDEKHFPYVVVRWAGPYGGRITETLKGNGLKPHVHSIGSNGTVNCEAEITLPSIPKWGKSTELKLNIEDGLGNSKEHTFSIPWPKAMRGNLIPLCSKSVKFDDWQSGNSERKFIDGNYFVRDANTQLWFVAPSLTSPSLQVNIEGQNIEIDLSPGYLSEMSSRITAKEDDLNRIAVIQRLRQLGLFNNRQHDVFDTSWAKINKELQAQDVPRELSSGDHLAPTVAAMLNGFSGEINVHSITAPSDPIKKLLESLLNVEFVQSISGKPKLANSGESFLYQCLKPSGANGLNLEKLKESLKIEKSCSYTERIFTGEVEITHPISADLEIADASLFHSSSDSDAGGGASLTIEASGSAKITVTGIAKWTARIDGQTLGNWKLQLVDSKAISNFEPKELYGAAVCGLVGFNVTKGQNCSFEFESKLDFNHGMPFSLSETPQPSVVDCRLTSNSCEVQLESNLMHGKPLPLRPVTITESKSNQNGDREIDLLTPDWQSLLVAVDKSSALHTPIAAAGEVIGSLGDAIQTILAEQGFGGYQVPVLSGSTLNSLLAFREKFRIDVLESVRKCMSEETFALKSFDSAKGLTVTVNGIDVSVNADAGSIGERLREAVTQYAPELAQAIRAEVVNNQLHVHVQRSLISRIAIEQNGKTSRFYPSLSPDISQLKDCLPEWIRPHAIKLEAGRVVFDFKGLAFQASGNSSLGSIWKITFVPAQASFDASFKVEPFKIQLDLNTLASDFQFHSTSPLIAIPAWKDYVLKARNAKGVVAVHFSNGTAKQLELSGTELVNFEKLSAKLKSCEVDIELSKPSGESIVGNGSDVDVRFKLSESGRTLRESQPNNGKSSSKSDGPRFRIVPHRKDSGEIDRDGYHLAMALGLLGTDMDDNGVIIGLPLHGKTWARDRISISPTKAQASVSIRVTSPRFKPFSFGFLDIQPQFNGKFSAKVAASCSFEKNAGEMLCFDNISPPTLDQTSQLKLGGTVRPLDAKCEIDLHNFQVTVDGTQLPDALNKLKVAGEAGSSLVSLFAQAAEQARQLNFAGTIPHVNISLSDLGGLADSLEAIVAKIQTKAPETLDGLFALIARNESKKLEGKYQWVVDLSPKDSSNSTEYLVINLELKDALQFTWVRTESKKMEFGLLFDKAIVAFDTSRRQQATVDGQIAISFGVDLEKAAGLKQSDGMSWFNGKWNF